MSGCCVTCSLETRSHGVVWSHVMMCLWQRSPVEILNPSISEWGLIWNWGAEYEVMPG
jgi:hypothetical protein